MAIILCYSKMKVISGLHTCIYKS